MPYPVRKRKKPETFQAFDEGGKHALVSQRVENARKKRKDRERKTVGVAEDVDNNVDKAGHSGSKKAKGQTKPKIKNAVKKST